MNTLHLLFRFNLCCFYLIATLVFIVDVQADEDVHAFDRERFQQALDKLHEQYIFLVLLQQLYCLMVRARVLLLGWQTWSRPFK